MMLVDCQTCPVREVQCADCVVNALTRLPAGSAAPARTLGAESGPTAPTRPGTMGLDLMESAGLPLDPAERRAVSMFLAAGLVTRECAEALRAAPDPVRAAATRRAAG